MSIECHTENSDTEKYHWWPEGIRPLSERKIICAFSNLIFLLSWGSQYVPDKLSILYWSLRTEEVRGEPFLGCLFVFVTQSSFTIIKCQQYSWTSWLLPTATHRYFLDCNRVAQVPKFKHSCLQYSLLTTHSTDMAGMLERTESIVVVQSVFVLFAVGLQVFTIVTY